MPSAVTGHRTLSVLGGSTGEATAVDSFELIFCIQNSEHQGPKESAGPDSVQAKSKLISALGRLAGTDLDQSDLRRNIAKE